MSIKGNTDMKKTFILFAFLIGVLLTVLISCSDKQTNPASTAGADTTNASTDTAVTTAPSEVGETDIGEYKIVRSDSSSKAIIAYVKVLKNEIASSLDSTLSVATDYIRNKDENVDGIKEILIGKTNRSESEEAYGELSASDSKDSFVIRVSENKIVILGLDDNMTAKGVKYFIDNIVKKSDKEGIISIGEGYSIEQKADPDTVVFDNLTEMKIEFSSDIFVPRDETTSNIYEYPTIVRLQYQEKEENNGKFLATFERGGGTYGIYESNDDGKNWSYIGAVKDRLNKDYCSEWMPFLYELPADIGEYKRGTVILAATSRSTPGDFDKSTITLYASTDLGRTFSAFCNVDEAGGLEWGVWEPFLIYDEETRRIYCFYADDSDPEHSQKLVYKYSTDLVNWSELKECVACSEYSLRPGMISITKMGNGEYYMVFEMVGIEGNPIYAKRTKDLDNWGDISDYGEIVAAKGKTFGSSPYTLWIPAGGECGTLIVVGKHPISGTSSTGTDMFVSFDYGKTFEPIDNPIPYTLVGHDRASYSPSLFASPDGEAFYYANCPDYGDATYKISFVKIKIIE